MNRSDFKRKLSSDNSMGKRLKWLRKKVDVGFRDIERALGIPESNIRSMENGGRTTIYEDLFLLADFFTKKLKEKFTTSNPVYKGMEIDEISVPWLMVGMDHRKKVFEDALASIREDFKEREMELIERNFALDMELTRLRNESSQKDN